MRISWPFLLCCTCRTVGIELHVHVHVHVRHLHVGVYCTVYMCITVAAWADAATILLAVHRCLYFRDATYLQTTLVQTCCLANVYKCTFADIYWKLLGNRSVSCILHVYFQQKFNSCSVLKPCIYILRKTAKLVLCKLIMDFRTVSKCTHTHTHAHAHARTRTHTHTHTHHTHTTHTCTHTHIHTHTHMHTHTELQAAGG